MKNIFQLIPTLDIEICFAYLICNAFFFTVVQNKKNEYILYTGFENGKKETKWKKTSRLLQFIIDKSFRVNNKYWFHALYFQLLGFYFGFFLNFFSSLEERLATCHSFPFLFFRNHSGFIIENWTYSDK